MKFYRSMTNFELYPDKILADGQFGTVYKAKNLFENTYVAIKKLKISEYGKFPRELLLGCFNMSKELILEIELVEKFQHKNIVSLLGVIVESNQLISMIFELLDMDLSRYLQQLSSRRLMEPPLIKSYLYQITMALNVCKELFVVHRDIRPGHLLIAADGVIKLADFCSAVSPTERSNTNIVKIYYRPPEVLLEASSPSYPVDIWALGCVFAEMVSKKILFKGETTQEQLTEIFKVLTTPTEDMWPCVTSFEHFNGIPKFERNCLAQKVPKIEESGLDLLGKMLIYDPDKRITATEMPLHPYFQDVNLTVKPRFNTQSRV